MVYVYQLMDLAGIEKYEHMEWIVKANLKKDAQFLDDKGYLCEFVDYDPSDKAPKKDLQITYKNGVVNIPYKNIQFLEPVHVTIQQYIKNRLRPEVIRRCLSTLLEIKASDYKLKAEQKY